MNDQVCGFIDNDNVLIFIEHTVLDRIVGLKPSFSLWRNADKNFLIS